MKKIFFIILLFVFFSAYTNNNTGKDCLNFLALTGSIDKAVFVPVKETSISLYDDVVTKDFKRCVKLAVDSSLVAANILFANLADVVTSIISDVGGRVEQSRLHDL